MPKLGKFPIMRRQVCILFIALGLLFACPAWAGTGGAEDSGDGGQDADQALRTAVRWILAIKGLKVLQSERTADFNDYRLDQKSAGATLMKTISDGLNQRKWKVSSRQDAKAVVLEASKDGKKLKVSLAKAGKEPRLTVEIRRTK